MKNKLIITEKQLTHLKVYIKEGVAHSNIVKQMKDEMDMNYVPIDKFVREGGEYFAKPMFMV